MSKSSRPTQQNRRLSATIVPILVTVAIATGGASAGLGESVAPAHAANPCAAKNPCNPCAVKNPCGPCGAANPCGAGNPCGPCGARGQAHSETCKVPRLAAAAKANPCAAKSPCNPCAPKQPCNPCAAKANPCNPCAAKANPCNPCGAANPCNPCAAAAKIDLTAEEAIAAYKCMLPELQAVYAKSGLAAAKSYGGWASFNVRPYVSDTHGGRYVNNYADKVGDKAYGKFEKAGALPVASVLAKDSFQVDAKGRLSVGPLFLMEKMKAGFNASSGDWRYALVGPNGAVIGVTNGQGSKNVEFCAECHAGVGETQDHLFFLPDAVRKAAK